MNDTSILEKMSLTELRKAVVDDPRNALLRHLLAAEMAQNRDYDGAVMEFSAALALNPLMHVARFQLGLLHLTMARPDHASTVLSPLDKLDDDSALKQFKRGLEALIIDDLALSAEHLKKGIELNHELPPLNRDMQTLLDKINQALTPTQSAETELTSRDAEATLGRAENDVSQIRTDFDLYNKNKH